MFRDVLAKRLQTDQQIIWTKKCLYTTPLPNYAIGSRSTELKTSLHLCMIIALQFEGYCNTYSEFPQSDGLHVALCYSI
jgi:hypothetical protein